MGNLLNQSKLFLSRNASTILTYTGGVGVIATAVMSIKATPKALALLDEAKEEKGEDLTKLEVVRVAGPSYIPAAIMGAATLACIFGANILNTRQQAALMSAYALLDNSYKDYKNKVKELYGAEADERVRQEIVKDKYTGDGFSDDNGKELFYDYFSERYFEATPAQVIQAEYEINHRLAIEYGVYLNEFYELLGLETVDYGNYLGWSSYELVESCWASWIEFKHEKVVMDDGLECTIISMSYEPTFDFENY
jgi:hypothetical protein